jgi:hypothetical protein
MTSQRKFQVFVSSTYNDLQIERQAAVSAILKAGHIPAGMELFAAGDKSQMDVIRRWIDDSDIYMLILGGRYGSVEDTTGLSYTELEYDYAISQGKPLFAIVIDENELERRVKSIGLSIDEREHPEKMMAFRKKVMSRMCSIFVDTKDIRGAVYESLHEINQTRDLVGWVKADEMNSLSLIRNQLDEITIERDKLQVELAEAKSRSDRPGDISWSQEDFQVLYDLLTSVQVEVPPFISNGKTYNNSVYELLHANRYLLTQGWTFAEKPDERPRWFEENLVAPLLVHKLVALTRTATGNRRYELTERGMDFVAWGDRIKPTRLKLGVKSASTRQSQDKPKDGSSPAAD